jgi:SNF2 family DNA or RNA helicase
MLELQGKKQQLIDGALGDKALKKSSKMTVDEMLFLFGL